MFQATRRSGIRNIVNASSEKVLGLTFDVAPLFMPVDEEYVARPESIYSLVKHLEERMTIELVRWDRDAQDHRTALLQRDGHGGLRGVLRV